MLVVTHGSSNMFNLSDLNELLDEDVTIPHEVVELVHLQGLPMIRAWREHLGLSQREVAGRMGVSQPAFARMEAPGVTPRTATLKKIAAALGLEWEQLR